MKSTNQHHSWLACMWHLYPPRALAHIGAGHGPSVIPYVDWGVEHVLLVDADSNACHQLAKNYSTRRNWQVKEALIAPGGEMPAFHVANSPAESGLLYPEHLREFWPNLRTSTDTERSCTSLDAVLRESFGNQVLPNWLVFGCFQAEALLASAPELLKGIEVISARVIIPSRGAPESRAHLDSLKSFMVSTGFSFLGVEEERNPAIGHALFVRDYKSLAGVTHHQLTQAKAEADKQLAERAAQLTQANQAKDAQAKLAAERQSQLEQLTQAKAEADKQLAERAAQLTQANQAKDAQAKLAAERQTQLEQLTQAKAEADKQLAERAAQLTQANLAKDAQAKLAAERQAQIEQLTQAKAEADKQLAERAAQLTQANQAKDAQAKLAAERQAQIEQLTQAKAEADKQLAERAAQLTQANQAKDAQAKLAAERQAQIEQLTLAKAEADKQLAERAAQLTQANLAKDAQAKLAAERQTQLEELTQAKNEAEKQRSELLARQQLMHGEITRAEAQIDLVKELLLRENPL